MIQELDTVILVKGRSDQGLVKGDMGNVVMVHDGGKAFEVEFVTLAGDTLGVLPMTANEVRPIFGKGYAAGEGGVMMLENNLQ
ncbi:MAG: DUF4926 domain-containing protein [Acidithiobacillus ferrooxidans]|nr:DUF4926 domain-containing protein [Acidithiobacillus ferrooxidans]MDD5003553.1 DUF4926 domain-containing protein [Acidithiobacillus sp.]MDD5378349.1 DUF4926 domain-containing protein [Acidithiobacillus sp.]MDD5576897.1 DUF4926 domain-containing protein [Acidithiobacillus sp.]